MYPHLEQKANYPKHRFRFIIVYFNFSFELKINAFKKQFCHCGTLNNIIRH